MRKNPIKILWLVIGFLAMGIGMIGVALPVLPTTPFLLLASFCLAKGSERFHKWFTGTKLYQKHLDSFVKNRAMTLKTKFCILLPASAMLILAMIAMSFDLFSKSKRTVERDEPCGDAWRGKVCSQPCADCFGKGRFN